jgi:alpha-glucosidase (family GH31 glycosyl hydrolase)
MLGDSVLVSPVLIENATTVEAYFPQGLWHSLWNASDVVDAR